MKNIIRKNSIHLIILIISLAVFLFCHKKPESPKSPYQYPDVETGKVVQNYHGIKVKDPYRWMEDPKSEKLKIWISKQNKFVRAYLDSFIPRDKIVSRLTSLWNYPKFTIPKKKGKKYFFSKNDGLQNQFVIYMQKGLKEKAELVLDPNKLSEDGTVALSAKEYSKHGKFMAYAISESGSDWQKIKIINTDTKKNFDDELNWCKFTNIAWKDDNSGFFYNRFPEEGSVPKEDQNNFNKVYWHKLGTPQSKDVLIYERPDAKELGFDPIMSDDGKFLLLHVYHGTSPKNRIYYRETDKKKGKFVRLLDKGDAKYHYISNNGNVFYFETDLNSPRGSIIAIDIKKPAKKNWKKIIGQADDVISFVKLVNNHFVVAYMHHAFHKLKIFNLNGKFIREIKLPVMGSIWALSGKPDDTEMFVLFSSFIFPTTIYRFDFTKDKLTLFRKSKVKFDPSGYTTEQVFYKSKDGTTVPMFLTYKKGIKLNGKNPTLLYGYGGFNINITPYFSIDRILWLENGGIFAIANLRGGSEYGESWHQAGMLGNKQNVFDDFIAASEYLIKNKYTQKQKLAIEGGSNGGLLVSASMLQRPKLFGAVVCRVPVTDMLRYHKFTVGRYWIPEYGNAEKNPKHFKFLYKYSPLHNVKKGVVYPPVLVTTADTDDRVVPMHAKKFVATMQARGPSKYPILMRVETKAGHGFGKPTTKLIEEKADIYSFLFKTFNMKFKSIED
jgi:prolyl oligopeptidase